MKIILAKYIEEDGSKCWKWYIYTKRLVDGCSGYRTKKQAFLGLKKSLQRDCVLEQLTQETL